MLTSKNDPLVTDDVSKILDDKSPADLVGDVISIMHDLARTHRLAKELKSQLGDTLATGFHFNADNIILILKLTRTEERLTMLLDALAIVTLRIEEAKENGSITAEAERIHRRMVQTPEQTAGAPGASEGD